MIKARVRNLNASSLAKAIEKKALEAAEASGAQVVELHRESIQTASSPTGGQQQLNSPGVRTAKGGRPPLHDTGRLLHGARATTHGRTVRVEPPTDRRAVVESLHGRGYETVWSGDERDFEPVVRREVERAAGEIDVRDHTREEVIE